MQDSVAAHYTDGQLLERILSDVQAIGKTPATVTVDELAPWMNSISVDARHQRNLSASWN